MCVFMCIYTLHGEYYTWVRVYKISIIIKNKYKIAIYS